MRPRTSLPVWLTAFVLLVALIYAPSMRVAHASSSGMVISAVFGGGSSDGDWRYDYVELFNAGTAPVDLNGWSIQYAAATQTTWNNWTYLPNVRLLPGQYFLIQEAGDSPSGSALPTPDLINLANPQNPHHLGSVSHKVALFSTTTRFTGGPNPVGSPYFVDLVGYGSANAYEGSTAAPAINTQYQAVRKKNGCQDTNNNGVDFKAVDEFTPRNSNSNLRPCGSAKQLLANGDFNLDSNRDAVPDSWSVQNRTSDDIVCNSSDKRIAFTGMCAFVFTGGANEAAILQQTLTPANLVPRSGDQFVLSAYVKAKNASSKLVLVLTVKYVGITKAVKASRVIGKLGAYSKVSTPAITLNGTPIEWIKVQFKHRSNAGKVFVDGAMLMLHKNGSRSNTLDLLPVPSSPVEVDKPN